MDALFFHKIDGMIRSMPEVLHIDPPAILNRVCFAKELFANHQAPTSLHHHLSHGSGPLHEHDFLEIALITTGTAQHATIHGRQLIKTGDLLVIHPGQWHGYSETRDLGVFNFCLSCDLFTHELRWVHQDPRLAVLFPARMPRDDGERRAAVQGVRILHFAAQPLARLTDAYVQLHALCASGGAKDRRGELLARILLVLEAIADHRDLGHGQRAHDGRVIAATRLMTEDPAREWSLDLLAEQTASSASHLLRLFRRDLGLAPIAWLARYRAERLAVLLLTSEHTIAELGAQVGWPEPSYCARRFRACFGLSPAMFRAGHVEKSKRSEI